MNAARLPSFAATLLRDARVARLATADTRSTPHVIPICFAFDGRAVYSAIDEKPKRASPRSLRRLRNIMANPRVAVVIDHYEEDWRRLRYVLVHGTAAIVDRGPEHRRAIALLRGKYRQYRSMRLEGRPVIKIVPVRVRAWNAAARTDGRTAGGPRPGQGRRRRRQRGRPTARTLRRVRA